MGEVRLTVLLLLSHKTCSGSEGALYLFSYMPQCFLLFLAHSVVFIQGLRHFLEVLEGIVSSCYILTTSWPSHIRPTSKSAPTEQILQASESLSQPWTEYHTPSSSLQWNALHRTPCNRQANVSCEQASTRHPADSKEQDTALHRRQNWLRSYLPLAKNLI